MTVDPAPISDPFLTLNQAFLRIYDQAVAATLARTRPILVVNRPNLVLLRETGREQHEVIPPLYDHLKAAAHVPLGLYALFAVQSDGAIGPDLLAQLQRFRDLTVTARAAFEPRGHSREQHEPLEQLLDRSLLFMDEILQNSSFARAELVSFLRGLRPAIEGSLAAAVRLEIDAYHARMQVWRQQLSAEEWRQLRVVVVEAPQARTSALGLEYFARLLGEPVQGGRIIFAESLYLSEPESWALDHVAKQELDTAVATAFFGDPTRLDRDILGDAALKYLETLTLE